jgi:peptidyl-tRNA hydrolase
MANLRQTIIVRTDLNLAVGLLAAQISHIHFEKIRRELNRSLSGIKEKEVGGELFKFSKDEWEWMESPYIFIHGVPNIEAYHYFKKKAEDALLSVVEWTDTIYLSFYEGHKDAFKNVPIGFSIGPADSDAIKAIVGALPLL